MVPQLIGYGTDPELGDYWLARNSWGKYWGEDGYLRQKRESTLECGTNNTPEKGYKCAAPDDGLEVQKVCGMCGLLSSPNYPVDVYAK